MSASAALAERPRHALTVSRSARKVKGQGGERREEILQHAQHLFAAHGVHSVSTRAIAEAVGISQPTLYAYFPKKSDILWEVCARAFRTLRDVGRGLELDGDPLEHMIRAYIAFGLEQPDAYRIAFMMELSDDEKHELEAHQGEERPGLDAFAGLRRIVASRLGADHPDLDIAAQSVWAGMHGLVSLLLVRCGFPWAEREALVDWHVAALMAGVPAAARAAA